MTLYHGMHGIKFYVERRGLKYYIVEIGEDGIHRVLSGGYWRWKIAARLAGELFRVWHDGLWVSEASDV